MDHTYNDCTLVGAGAAYLEDEVEQLCLPRFFAADENAVNHKVHHTREKYVIVFEVRTS